MSTRPKIDLKSVPVILAIDRDVRRHNVRGSLQVFQGVVADAIDGHFTRRELDDLIKRRMLSIENYVRDKDKDGRPCFEFYIGNWKTETRGPHSVSGLGWGVYPTPKLIKTFWPERYVS